MEHGIGLREASYRMFQQSDRSLKRPEFPVQSKQGEPTTYDENSPSNGVAVGQALEKLVYINTPSCQKKAHHTHLQGSSFCNRDQPRAALASVGNATLCEGHPPRLRR